jgi:hypothetical protein
MNISKIIKIMEFAFLNPEKYEEEFVRKKFGEKAYNQFSQFCMGGTEPLARYMVDEKLKLTQKGVREYHKLKSEKSQKEFNRIIAFTAAILALIGIYDFLYNLNLITGSNWITAAFIILVIGALGPIIYFIINSYYSKY